MLKYIYAVILLGAVALIPFESFAQVESVASEDLEEMSLEEERFYRVLGFKAPFKYSVVSERFNALDSLDPAAAETDMLEEANGSIAEDDLLKAVILVKDYHCYYPAQLNVLSSLNFLSANLPFIRSFLFEGASGDIDLSVFRAFNDYNIRKNIADFLMREGFVSAGENIAIANLGVEFNLFGLENATAYNEHFNSFLQFTKDNELLKKYVNNINSVSKYLKYSLFSETAIKFLEKKKEYYSYKSVALEDYAIYLRNKAVNFKIDYKQFANFPTYMELLNYTSIINHIKIRAATDDIIGDMQSVVSVDDFNEVLSRNLKYNQGIISEKDYYTFLRELMEVYEVKIRPTHILARYFTYLDIKENIDFDVLQEEISALEHFILKEFLKDDLQNLLYEMMAEYELFKKILNFEALPSDVIKVKKAVLDFFQLNVTFQSLFISIFKSERIKQIEFSAKYMQDKMNSAQIFYDLAKARNKYLIYNINKFMDETGDAFPLVFLGDFHLQGVAEELRNQNISYIVLEPKISKRDNELYLRRMHGAMPLDSFRADKKSSIFSGDSNLAPYIYLSDSLKYLDQEDKFREELFYLYAVLRMLYSLDPYRQRALMGKFTIDNPEFYEMINKDIADVLTVYLKGKKISERVKVEHLFETLRIADKSCRVSSDRIIFVIGDTKVYLKKATGLAEQSLILYNGFRIEKITNIK